MQAVTLVTILALIQFAFFGALVARARSTYGISAPAMAGHEIFERMHRVHANTLERLVLFLPLLWMATIAWKTPWIAAAGVVFLVGRMLYWRGYVANPPARRLGNAVTMVSIGVLLIANIVALVRGVLA